MPPMPSGPGRRKLQKGKPRWKTLPCQRVETVSWWLTTQSGDDGGEVGTLVGFQRRWISLTMAFVVTGLAACSKEEPAPPPPPRMVRVVKADFKAAELGGQATG